MNEKKLKIISDMEVSDYISAEGDYDYVEIMYGKSADELQEIYSKFVEWIRCIIIEYTSEMYSLAIIYKTSTYFNIKL